jgi:tetratricopeptide (TPR) repeat protein
MTALFRAITDKATAEIEEALSLYRAAHDARGEAWALQNLAWVAYTGGDSTRAEEWLTESVEAFTEIGDSGGLGWAMGLLAFVRFHQGRMAEAEAMAQSLVAESSQRGDRWGEGMLRNLIALVALWSGRTSDAIEHGQQALALFRTISDWYGELLSVGIVGRALIAVGRVDEGFNVLTSGVASASSTGVANATAMAEIQLVTAAAQAGLPDRNPHALDDDELRLGDMGFVDRTVSYCLLHLQQGDAAPALETLERARKVHADNGNVGSALALAQAANGDPESARLTALEVNGSDSATYSDRVLATVAGGLAMAQLGDEGVAKAMLRTAQELADGTDDALLQAVTRLAEARAGERLGHDGAADAGRRARLTLAAMGVADSGWDDAFAAAAGL